MDEEFVRHAGHRPQLKPFRHQLGESREDAHGKQFGRAADMQGLFEGDPLEHFGFDHCFQGVQVRGQAPGKLVGGTGRPDPVGSADEELPAEFLLKGADLRGHCRLGHPQVGGCPGE